ncbi:hypothetical protein PR202_ga29119 [Eleusine coracana subsp. coracana]|uniref:DUF4057 domain-containing protein n=1 Tax=Eleusine coracana subsp. coracana TaxID=191504 RepID=A0AAV5DKB6_ELECO|nr:hypothetical protein PR202_ga29119 [Eleusine coracana subsp. coracana]
MERPAPVRKSHTNTADLLIWPEGAPQDPGARGHAAVQPPAAPGEPATPSVPHCAPFGTRPPLSLLIRLV